MLNKLSTCVPTKIILDFRLPISDCRMNLKPAVSKVEGSKSNSANGVTLGGYWSESLEAPLTLRNLVEEWIE